MIKVRFLGNDLKRAYHGMDPETKIHIHINKGEVIEVSKKKKQQLFDDFPEEWELVYEKVAETGDQSTNRDDLKKALDDLGVLYAKNTSTKKLEELYANAQKGKTDE